MLVAGRRRFDQERADRSASELNKITLAAVCESVYSGAERALALIAREFDGAPVAKSDTWHKDLILRMGAMFEAREAVLSKTSMALMHDLRGFRHKVRSHYGSVLVPERVREISIDAEALARGVSADIEVFLASLDAD